MKKIMVFGLSDENRTNDLSNMKQEVWQLQNYVSYVPEIHIYDSVLKLNIN
jgi:hypothetical protein